MLSKEELIELLASDVDAFNNALGEEYIDLSEVDFTEMNIEGAIFNNVDLTSSSFSDAHLTEVKFIVSDLTSVDFTRANLVECEFNDCTLNGTDFSYSVSNYCNFAESDFAGAILSEADFNNSDFSTSENLNASRFDDTTIWPDSENLPEDFDSSYTKDLSSLSDDEDSISSDY